MDHKFVGNRNCSDISVRNLDGLDEEQIIKLTSDAKENCRFKDMNKTP